MSALAASVLSEIARAGPQRGIEATVEPGLAVQGDARLIRVLLENLLGNAWKFTARCESPRIEFGAVRREDGDRGRPSPGDRVLAFFVRDNGAGFDSARAEKLFAPFQRFHRAEDYPGTGIGLATVRRIVQRHGGQVWASSEPGKGASFFFTLTEDAPSLALRERGGTCGE